MKVRNGFVSNSSSSSFIVTERKIETLREMKKAIERFLDDYDSDNPDNFWLTVEEDGTRKVELSTEADDRGERLLYEIFDSILY